MSNDIEKLELEHLEVFKEEEVNSQLKEKVENTKEHKIYRRTGSIGEKKVYQNCCGELELLDDCGKLIWFEKEGNFTPLDENVFEEITHMMERIENYKGEKSDSMYIRYTVQVNEGFKDLKKFEETTKAEIDTLVQNEREAMMQRAEEAQKQKEEAIKRAEEIKQGIITDGYFVIKDCKEITASGTTNYNTSRSDIKKIIFTTPLKIDTKEVNKILIKEEWKGINNIKEFEWFLFEYSMKVNANCTIELKDSRVIALQYDDKGHISINNNKCPRNITERIIRRLLNSSFDLEKTINIEKKLGVRKQLLCGMTECSMGEVYGKSSTFPISITPIDEENAEVEFLGKKNTILWKDLTDEFIYGNSIRHWAYYNRINLFLRNGWNKEEMFKMMKEILILKEV